jgi:hypothetical protein
MDPLSPETALRLAGIVECVADAGPEGIGFVQLGMRTGFGSIELSRILGAAVERGFVRVNGTRYLVR